MYPSNSNQIKLSQTTIGFERVIVDTGPEGMKMFDELTLFLRHTSDFFTNYVGVTRIVYKSILDDLVSFLNLPPIEALDRVQRLDSFTFHQDPLGLLGIKEKDIFNELLSTYVLRVYLKIRSQFTPEINIQYRLDLVGIDHIVIKEYQTTVIKLPNHISLGELSRGRK